MKKYVVLLMLCTMMQASCEKPFADDDPLQTEEANVILHLLAYDHLSFTDKQAAPMTDTRATTDISNICTHINLTVYDGETKVKSVSQKQSDEVFGDVALSLSEGTYQLVIVAHSCDGSAIISSADKVTFPNNVVSDTFYYYGDLIVTSDSQAKDIELMRAVSMFRLVITDEIPSSVEKLKFYYTGGSSTFSPMQGYGSVNSRQTVVLPVEQGQNTFDVYTFPHEETGVLKMTVTALDANGNAVKERVFEQVPVKRNEITRYTGEFFESSGDPAKGEVMLKANSEWAAENSYTF